MTVVRRLLIVTGLVCHFYDVPSPSVKQSSGVIVCEEDDNFIHTIAHNLVVQVQHLLCTQKHFTNGS